MYTPQDLAELSTTELLALTERTDPRLTAAQLRAIRAEIDSRRI